MNDPRLFLIHMRESIERIEAYTEDGREAFLADQRTIDAVVRNFEIIGEASRRLPAEVKSRAPRVPWKEIGDFRNFLIHVYESVDPVKVWGVVEQHLPPLRAVLDALLGPTPPPPPSPARSS